MIYIIMIIMSLFPLMVQATPPDAETISMLDELKDRYDFDKWPAAEPMLIPRVDMSMESIEGIDPLTHYDSYRRLIEIYSDNDEQEYCSRYSYSWKTSSDNRVRITLLVHTSAKNAREHLIYLLMYSQTPVIRDNPAVAGEVTFNNGTFYIRNNIIVTIDAIGEFNKIISSIAPEVDAILLRQKTYSPSEVMPYLSELSFDKTGEKIARISFTTRDPRQGTADWEYRLSRGGIYKKEDNAIYLYGGVVGDLEVIIIAFNESGFTMSRSLSMTVTENDIFN